MNILKSSTKVISILLVFTFLLTNSAYSLSLLKSQDILRPMIRFLEDKKTEEISLNKKFMCLLTSADKVVKESFKKDTIEIKEFSAYSDKLKNLIKGFNNLAKEITKNDSLDIVSYIDRYEDALVKFEYNANLIMQDMQKDGFKISENELARLSDIICVMIPIYKLDYYLAYAMSGRESSINTGLIEQRVAEYKRRSQSAILTQKLESMHFLVEVGKIPRSIFNSL